MVSAFGQFIRGQARFHAGPDDSLAVIKKQLIYLATQDIISQELEVMGFDSKLFWRRYQKALKEELELIKTSLEKAYRMKSPDQTPQQRQGYWRVWRKRRLKISEGFGNLLQALDSYKVGRITRSSQDSMIRYIKMEGKVNRSKLEKIYFQFAQDTTVRAIDHVYWTFNLGLTEGDWEQFGIARKEELLAALNELFLKKLQQELGISVQNIILTDPSSLEKIQAHLRSSESRLAQLRSEEQTLQTLINSVWIHANLRIGLFMEVAALEQQKLASQGDFIVTELRYNKPIYLSKIKFKKHHIPRSKQRSLPNKVGQHVYQRIVAEFVPMKFHLAQLSENLNQVPLHVTGYGNYVELKAVRDSLSYAARKYQLRTYLDYFSLSDAQIILEYTGQKSDLGKILATIHGQSLENGKMISMDTRSDPLGLKLIASP